MLRADTTRLTALHDALAKLDPPMAIVLNRHLQKLPEIEAVLREANIQLAAPHLQTHTVITLRDRIDVLLGSVPRPMPISQSDDE